MPPTPDPRSFLPLTPAVFHILLSLADEDRHGYAIAEEVEAMTRGEVKLGPSTLYGTIDRMAEAALIVETDQRDRDERRRYFHLTTLGRSVARAEALRLEQLLGIARAKAILSRGRS